MAEKQEPLAFDWQAPDLAETQPEEGISPPLRTKQSPAIHMRNEQPAPGEAAAVMQGWGNSREEVWTQAHAGALSTQTPQLVLPGGAGGGTDDPAGREGLARDEGRRERSDRGLPKTHASFFSGVGGLDMGIERAGWRPSASPRSSRTHAPSSESDGPMSPTSATSSSSPRSTEPRAVAMRGREGGSTPETSDEVSALRAASGGSSRAMVLPGSEQHSGAAGFHARTSASPESERDSPMPMATSPGADSPTPSLTLWSDSDLPSSSWRTYRGSYPAIEAKTLGRSSVSWGNSAMGGPSGFWTLATSEWPNGAVECSLSAVLEASVPQRYFLGPRAALGILRRAHARGKALDERLTESLTGLAMRWLLDRMWSALSLRALTLAGSTDRTPTPDSSSPPSATRSTPRRASTTPTPTPSSTESPTYSPASPLGTQRDPDTTPQTSDSSSPAASPQSEASATTAPSRTTSSRRRSPHPITEADSLSSTASGRT